jgi:hypothetical protein
MLLDRRVDPDLDFGFAATGTLGQVLEGLMAAYNKTRYGHSPAIGFSVVEGALVYIGPTEFVRVLRTVIEIRGRDIGRVATDARMRLASKHPLKWSDLAEPREVLSEIARDWEVEVVGSRGLPHDLWAGADLPALPFCVAISIVLGQFDLTFQMSEGGAVCSLAPLDYGQARVDRRYTFRQLRGLGVDRLRELVGDALVRSTPDGFVVTGLVEQHERIDFALAGDSVGRVPTAEPNLEHVYSMRTGAAIRDILEHIKGTLKSQGMTLVVDPTLSESPDFDWSQRVRYEGVNATLDELLTGVLIPAGLSYERTGQRIRVFR